MPRLSAAERRAGVDKFAHRRCVLVSVCMVCHRWIGAPVPVSEDKLAGISDGLHHKCIEAYKAAYGFGSKKAAA